MIVVNCCLIAAYLSEGAMVGVKMVDLIEIHLALGNDGGLLVSDTDVDSNSAMGIF